MIKFTTSKVEVLTFFKLSNNSYSLNSVTVPYKKTYFCKKNRNLRTSDRPHWLRKLLRMAKVFSAKRLDLYVP